MLLLKSKSLWGLQEGGISFSFSNPSPDPDGPHLPLLPPLLVHSPSHNSFPGFAKDPADQEAVPSISSLTQLQQMTFNLSGPQCPYILARKVRKRARRWSRQGGIWDPDACFSCTDWSQSLVAMGHGPIGAPEAARLSPHVPQPTPGPQISARIGRTSGPLAYLWITCPKGQPAFERGAGASPL